MNYKIIAVDFDGTLCENRWPKIGKPNMELIEYLIEEQRIGSRVILWTCRSGSELHEAILWCERHGLRFDGVNCNMPDAIDMFGGSDPRKIFAHEYIDDRMCGKFKLPFKKGE